MTEELVPCSVAAVQLGVSASTVSRKVEKLNLKPYPIPYSKAKGLSRDQIEAIRRDLESRSKHATPT